MQMDASPFDWLGNGQILHLHCAVDVATGKILALYLDCEETLNGYCDLMRQMNRSVGLPRELYTDGRTVFVYNPKHKKKLSLDEELAGLTEKKPQFARALDQIGCSLIIARSPQAKGRVEKLWRTLQDRLVKDLRRYGVTTLEQANLFLLKFIARYNRRFAVMPAAPDSVFLPSLDSRDFELIFARHDFRKLDHALSFSFQNRKFVLPAAIGKTKIPASPHDVITVISGRNVGIQVLFQRLVFSPIEIPAAHKSSIAPSAKPLNTLPASAKKPPTPSPFHPWRNPFRNRSNLPDATESLTN